MGSALLYTNAIGLVGGDRDDDQNPSSSGGIAVTDRLERRELDRREEDHNRDHDHASKWSNPALWVSICSVLLTIVLATFGFIAAKLSTIDASIQSTRDEVQSTRTAVVAVTTRQERDNGALEARIRNLENAVNVQQNAFNFSFTTRLATAEAKVGIRAPRTD